MWVVGFWHLSNYGECINTAFPYSGEITHAAMGVFMFWGGFFLQKYKISTINDALSFYKKRFSRFYFLYLLSILTLFIGGLFTIKPWFKSTSQLLLTIFGLSAFKSPNVGTLWFMSMLMFFYVLTPIINSAKTITTKIIYVFIPLAIMILYKHVYFHLLDSRIFMLYITYFSGLLISPEHCIKTLKSWYSPICGLMMFLLFGAVKSDSVWITIICRTIYTYGAIFMLYYICYHIVHNSHNRLSPAIQWMSYVLMSMYLFHRQIYQSLEILYNKLNIEITIWHNYLIFLPVGLICAYIIQKLYDIVFYKITNH